MIYYKGTMWLLKRTSFFERREGFRKAEVPREKLKNPNGFLLRKFFSG